MNKKERKPFNQSDYIPKRFGLKYVPPQIIIEYLIPTSGKLYHHKIRLHKFNSESKVQDVMKEIYEKHYLYLDNKKVNSNQISKLIEKIRSNYKQTNEKTLSRQTTAITKNELKPNEKILEQKNGQVIEVQSKEKEDNQKEEEDEYNFDEFEDEDLNKLDTDELKVKKEQMDKFYDKNNIRVGDSNFIYDIRKDFNNNVNYGAEWDDDSY